jgi:hypothetical protein
LGGDQQVNFQAVEVAALAGLVTPPRFAPITPAPGNAAVVAGGDRKTVDDVDALGPIFPNIIINSMTYRLKPVG